MIPEKGTRYTLCHYSPLRIVVKTVLSYSVNSHSICKISSECSPQYSNNTGDNNQKFWLNRYSENKYDLISRFPMADLAGNPVFHWSQWLLRMKKRH